MTCGLGGTEGTCTPLPKGITDTCGNGQACNNGSCANLNGKKAIGEPCGQNSDCFNGNCFPDVGGGLCRIPEGQSCEQGYTFECELNFCKPDGTCGNCATDADCAPGKCDPVGLYCRLVAGQPCSTGFGCVSNVCSSNVCQ